MPGAGFTDRRRIGLPVVPVKDLDPMNGLQTRNILRDPLGASVTQTDKAVEHCGKHSPKPGFDRRVGARGCGGCGRSKRCEFLVCATRRLKTAPTACPSALSAEDDSGSTPASADERRHTFPTRRARGRNTRLEPQGWACLDTTIPRRDYRRGGCLGGK